MKKLLKVLNELEGKALKKVLEDLLTPAELQDVEERILIVEALLKGQPQRTVAQRLGVSIAKVSRGSQLIQYGKGALVKRLG